jgi:hypothetical protein
VERAIGRWTRLEPDSAVRFLHERLDVRVDRLESFESGSDVDVDARYTASARMDRRRRGSIG